MKILMFGWEYPPVKSGGLGTACYGLTKAMAKQDAIITLVVPRAEQSDYSTHLNLIDGKDVKIKKNTLKYYEINSLLTAYETEESYEEKYHHHTEILSDTTEKEKNHKPLYGKDLFQEVWRFAQRAGTLALRDNYEIIVGHDWMTVDACLLAKKMIKKPFILHIHATEFDRTGGNPNKPIYELEKKGMEQADLIIANSHITKENCIKYYGIDPNKIVPVHLAIDQENYQKKEESVSEDKIVLFLARITIQKGPEYFINAARLALDFDPHLKFIMAGSGHDLPKMIHYAAELGISDRFFFTGSLDSEKAREAYNMADLFVMTSVAEPFGLTVLEAIRSGIPCIIPKNAGIAEILSHVIKINFWDVHELANSIVNILKYPALHRELKHNSHQESEKMTWENTARKTLHEYRKILRKEVPVYA